MANEIPTPTPTPAATGTPPAPPVQQQPMPQTQPYVPPQYPNPNNNNIPNNNNNINFRDMVKRINWSEVIFGALGACALYFVINYYKYAATSNKAFQVDTQNKIDDLNIKVADIASTQNSQTKSADGVNDFF